MIRCTLLLVALTLSGCVSSDTVYSTAGPTSITGHKRDLNRYVPLCVQLEWQIALTDRSKGLAVSGAKYPKTAIFQGAPRMDAYFDKQRTVTVVDVYGNVESYGDGGQVAPQSYYLTWETSGDVRTLPSWQQPEWGLSSVSIFDYQF